MQNSNNYWVVIPAAGVGRRMEMDVPKQYILIHGKTIIEHALDSFINREDVKSILVSISKSDNYWSRLPISKNKKIITVIGGKERHESVYNGLCNLKDKADDDDWVLVHDAVRPYLKKSIIDRLITNLNCHDTGGILALPCYETMKRINDSNEIEQTIDREFIWRAQTPQMFKYKKLLSAIEKSIKENIFITDEAMAMELSNYKPMIIHGDKNNIKITDKNDLQYFDSLLSQPL